MSLKSTRLASRVVGRGLAISAFAMLLVGAMAPEAKAEDAFQIHPDYHLTPEWVKAGAYFTEGGQSVRVDQVEIVVTFPMGGGRTERRVQRERGVDNCDFSGWWDEPWREGYFDYTVRALYGGTWYEAEFTAGRNRWFEGGETALRLLEEFE